MDGLSSEEYVPFVRGKEADDMLEKNTLAAAALPDYRRNLVLVNREVCLVENSLFVKALGDLSEFYQWHFHIGLYMRKDVTT
jgi:hypothetical protein